jgi:hypothetical protein
MSCFVYICYSPWKGWLCTARFFTNLREEEILLDHLSGAADAESTTFAGRSLAFFPFQLIQHFNKALFVQKKLCVTKL